MCLCAEIRACMSFLCVANCVVNWKITSRNRKAGIHFKDGGQRLVVYFAGIICRLWCHARIVSQGILALGLGIRFNVSASFVLKSTTRFPTLIHFYTKQKQWHTKRIASMSHRGPSQQRTAMRQAAAAIMVVLIVDCVSPFAHGTRNKHGVVVNRAFCMRSRLVLVIAATTMTTKWTMMTHSNFFARLVRR